MEYTAIPRDTTLEAFRVQIDVMRRLGVEGRAKLTFELCKNLRQVLTDGVRFRHPDYTDDQVRLAVIRLRLGEKLFRKVYPGVEIKP
ncbi:MAG TPA: hypothetical protein VGY55_21905 [Pirellulales bacterium]|jgi:hypothetical protein|nr:hypothetical protein [Pirellulales bacterium]